MKILIAEDNRFYRCMLEATLAEWGYEVVAADDGRAAWQVLQEKDAPRLAILDWLMPGIDGLELCRKVRARGGEEPTYLILLTAKGDKQDIVTGLKAGADDYISKPFDRDELHARLQVGLRVVGLQASLAARVRELEQALSGAQKMEAVGRLAGGVAHDFNNLLTVILGSGDVLLSRMAPDDPLRESVRMIKQAGERGAGLTRQLLAFSRRQMMAPEVLSLNLRVAGLEDMLRRLIGEHITLVTRLEPALHPVKADPGQIDQVLMNLLVNARDAMPEGGTITIETHNVHLDPGSLEGRGPEAASPNVLRLALGAPVRPGHYALVSVTDTGVGMDEETKRHLFEPFFTTKEVGKGTGLGLATVYGIVKQSDGHIVVDSEPGRGTAFQVYLPRAREISPPPRPAPAETRPAPAKGSETVLLVEDEEAVRMLTRTVLQLNHYTVLEASDGLEALRVSGEWPNGIDLMLTDLVMPRLNGPQLADRLLPARPGMKVLYMSGYTDANLVQNRLREAGARFLQKPFTPEMLARTVREVLDQE